jgi:hypothetical protein
MELFKGGCGNFGDLFSMMKDLPSPDQLQDLMGSGKF